MFLSSSADIAIYGGAAGGGKTWALLFEPLRNVQNSRFGGVIFRRTSPQIRNKGGLWDGSRDLYPHLSAQPRETLLDWTFPSGATIKFAHLEYEKNVEDYQGSQIPFIGFDELTHFTERQFWYMLSRNRSTSGVKPYVRGTCNPDPDSWVAKFLEWWIDDETGYAIPERAGVIRWFVRVNDVVVWADSPEELRERYPWGVEPKSATFVPAKLSDNKILMEADPGYKANLLAQPYVDQMRLLHGNWKVRATAGKVFNRAWFEIVEAVPPGGVECAGWDFAATEKQFGKTDPDSTARIKIRKVNGTFYVTDSLAVQEGPAEVENLFINVSKQDAEAAALTRTRFLVRWEQEPASAAKRESYRLTRQLAGLDAIGVRSHSDKFVRAKPFAVQAQVGNVKLLKGPWNERFLNQLHNQPDAPHEDEMDGASLAFNELAKIEEGGEQSRVFDEPIRDGFLTEEF